MKRAIIKNGLIAVAILMGIQLVAYIIYGAPDSSNFDVDEIVGYISIVLCLSFVFLGIRESRIQSGKTSFLNDLGVGAAIAAFPSFAFGIYSVIYYKWINPNFLEEYGAHQLNKMKANLGPEEFKAAEAQLASDMALWDSVGMQFFIMFMTVFVIGLIISVLSSLFFQLKPVKK